MSRDYQLGWPCPHLTVEEVVSLGADRRSLDCRQPVAAANTVRVMVNDEFFVPQSGLHTPAHLFGSLSGPFELAEGEDTLVVETPSGSETFSFGLTRTVRLSADQMVQAFLRDGLSVASVESVNGHLALTDPSTVGPESFVKVSGKMAPALGFGRAESGDFHQWKAWGRTLYPSWQLHTRPDEITNRFPKFDRMVRANPIFKVTYAVPPSRCLRCGGTYVENDMRFDETGQALMVENENLLYQAALKILLTDRGSNPYHTWYGTLLRSRIGSKALGGVATKISEDVRQALSKYQALQQAQSKYQRVSYREKLYSVLSVNTEQHVQDPTTFMIGVVVQNASGKPIDLTVVYTVPEVVALMGSNGLMLGPEYVGLAKEQTRGLFPTGKSKMLPGGE